MNRRTIDLILKIPNVELFIIDNPSQDHPDNPLYYQLKAKGFVTLKDTEESGIFAIGLTDYGRKLQEQLRRK